MFMTETSILHSNRPMRTKIFKYTESAVEYRFAIVSSLFADNQIKNFTRRRISGEMNAHLVRINRQ
ncbi:MAG: hypothetical protein DRP51_06175 [Candidatus Zixiibacteriota bacterium]|nr:MAG: hypothetical protein DRP51_06175 [candidate division Zixibacteria bacterium]